MLHNNTPTPAEIEEIKAIKGTIVKSEQIVKK